MSLSVAVMPAKKTTTKRKSEAIVEDEKDLKKVKGKSLFHELHQYRIQ